MSGPFLAQLPSLVQVLRDRLRLASCLHRSAELAVSFCNCEDLVWSREPPPGRTLRHASWFAGPYSGMDGLVLSVSILFSCFQRDHNLSCSLRGHSLNELLENA